MNRKIASDISLAEHVRQCTACADVLPLGPQPVFQFHPAAKILIASQAPGKKVHESGIPFDDASGDRLRDWMAIDRKNFYNEKKIAILPMGFCYPGKAASGDAPPRKECAPLWRAPLLQELQQLKLILAIGKYAIAWHLPTAKGSLTETVRHCQEFGNIIPLPHPSPLNNIWLAKNPWFSADVLPYLREQVAAALHTTKTTPRRRN